MDIVSKVMLNTAHRLLVWWRRFTRREIIPWGFPERKIGTGLFISYFYFVITRTQIPKMFFYLLTSKKSNFEVQNFLPHVVLIVAKVPSNIPHITEISLLLMLMIMMLE